MEDYGIQPKIPPLLQRTLERLPGRLVVVSDTSGAEAEGVVEAADTSAILIKDGSQQSLIPMSVVREITFI